jgi:hypothetical protein
MRRFLTGFTLLIALVLLAPVGDAFAPKLNYTTGSVQFRDWDGDAITSDTGAAYVDGVKGLEVRIWTGGSQDVTVGTFRSGRTVRYVFTPATDVDQPTLEPPLGILSDNSFVNIHNIASMTVGDTKITRASFNTAVGYFRWLGAPHPGTGATTGVSYGSQAVVVTRTGPMTWDVHTPDSPAPFSDGSPIPMTYYAGNLAVLLKDAPRNTLAPVGLYHMSFGLAVTCPSCQAP